MDRDEAIKLLSSGQEGIAEWNQRRESGEGIPELGEVNLNGASLRGADLNETFLRGADLSSADLSEANLTRAYLNEANLVRANLYRAILRHAIVRRAKFVGANLIAADLSAARLSTANLDEANLSGANLREADLFHAQLTEANLRGASLTGADLSEALVRGAVFSGANLDGADFSRATCNATVFACVNLAEVQGLDSVKHNGPSTIGIDTIFLSKGKIPEVLLRGCGVPESLIQSLPLILNSTEPIQFYSCFISYSSKNQPFAERLHADLQAKGVRTWFDQEDLKIGDKIRHGINEAIRVHDKLMLVLTEHSISSDWVEGEVEAALERERREKRTVLFPIRLDDAVMETPTGWASHIRQTRHIGDFRAWENHGAYQNAFARLLRDLRASEASE